MNYVELLMFSEGGATLWLERVDDITYAPDFQLPEVLDDGMPAAVRDIIRREYGMELTDTAIRQFHLRMVPDTSAMPLAKGLYKNDMVHAFSVWLPPGVYPAHKSITNFSIDEDGMFPCLYDMCTAIHLRWLVPLALDRRVEHSYTRWT